MHFATPGAGGGPLFLIAFKHYRVDSVTLTNLPASFVKKTGGGIEGEMLSFRAYSAIIRLLESYFIGFS